MSKDLHTLALKSGSSSISDGGKLSVLLLRQQAYGAGNGDPSAIAAGAPGLGYTAIPTVAFANAGSGSGETAAAVMGVVGVPTIAAGGTGGTTGAATVTGTTGTGTKFQAAVTIAGGAITAVNSVTVAGAYTVLPTTLTAEPVTGGSLTGATLNLSAAMGVVSYTLGGTSNHQYAQGTTATVSGGTPTTAAMPGAVTITSVAGQGTSFSVSGAFPMAANGTTPLYSVFPGDPGADLNVYTTNRTATGFTVNLIPNTSGATVAAGAVDLLVLH